MPYIQDRLNHAPSRFHHVCALKQSGIAHHAVVQQPFLSGAGHVTKVIFVVKVHVDRADIKNRSGYRRGSVSVSSNRQLDSPKKSRWNGVENAGQ